MKLKPVAFALTCGILWGVAVMLATWWIVLVGSAGHTIITLKNFYSGYSVSYFGGIVGLVWGFASGLISGYLFARIYNALVKEK
jgi:hypothetical protein